MSETVIEATPVAPHARPGAFEVTDWGLLAGVALTWGSSFVLIEIALEDFAPPLITLLRILFGLTTIVWIKRARTPIARSDWRAVTVVGLLWMAIPFLLFPIAQQWIDSSLAGMINGSVPLFATFVATLVSRRLPRIVQAIGLMIGFVGVVAVSWPAVQDARATATGALLILLACMCYGTALNVMVPLQRKYGALPVLLRVQAVAVAATLVPGIVGATRSTFSWPSLAAMIPLGCLGTGLAFVGMTTLAGRVGAARASVTIYFVPVVAIALGVLFLDEKVAVISLVGTALVLLGAYLTSRAERA
jgi:drug/metabolite transporter (DMT)-like permease